MGKQSILGSGALADKMLLVRIIEKIIELMLILGLVRLSKGYLFPTR